MESESKTQRGRRWGRGERADSDSARQRIISAARRCYSRKGVTATTMSDVAAEAGVVRGTLYRYFPRKESILLHIFREEIALFIDRFREETPVPASFCDYLLDYMMFSLRFSHETPMHRELFAEQSALWVSRNYLDDPETLALTEDLLREPFRSAQVSGELQPDLTLPELVRWTARILMSYILLPDNQGLEECRETLRRLAIRAITHVGKAS